MPRHMVTSNQWFTPDVTIHSTWHNWRRHVANYWRVTNGHATSPSSFVVIMVTWHVTIHARSPSMVSWSDHGQATSIMTYHVTMVTWRDHSRHLTFDALSPWSRHITMLMPHRQGQVAPMVHAGVHHDDVPRHHGHDTSPWSRLASPWSRHVIMVTPRHHGHVA